MYQLCLFIVVAFLSVNLLSNATTGGFRPPMEGGRLDEGLIPSQISISLSLVVIYGSLAGGCRAAAGLCSASLRCRTASFLHSTSVKGHGSPSHCRSLQGLSTRACLLCSGALSTSASGLATAQASVHLHMTYIQTIVV